MSSAEKPLYKRLGGYDAIAAVVTHYVDRIRADPKFAHFAGGRSTDKKMRDVQMNIDYLCKITGGPMYYMGRDLRTSHAGLNITADEWQANMRYWAEALDAHKIPQKEKEEVLALVESMRGDIVEG